MLLEASGHPCSGDAPSSIANGESWDFSVKRHRAVLSAGVAELGHQVVKLLVPSFHLTCGAPESEVNVEEGRAERGEAITRKPLEFQFSQDKPMNFSAVSGRCISSFLESFVLDFCLMISETKDPDSYPRIWKV